MALAVIFGRIAETFWMHGGQPSGTYVLTYDGFGRLRDGWHYLYGNPTNAWSERNITYDQNGNIKTLLRYGSSGATPLNDYSFSYEGNRALLINGTSWYEYDFSGNVTGDAARGMAIGYNLLNLPSWFNDGQSDMMVFYDYLADGTKVALHREDTGMGRAWLGDLVFNLQEDARDPEDPGDGSRGARTSTLSKRDTTGTYMKVVKNVNLRGPEDEEDSASYSFESTPYAGGRIESIGNGIKVRKFVTDHLGSVRAIVTDNAVVERNDYYPFGGRHDNPLLTTLTSNRYGFIGKERQNISSSLDPYIDFGARFYDPLTARWLSPDPLADKYTSLTQYNYCGGDPVNYVDPDGQSWYYNELTGAFVAHLVDDDDKIYLLTDSQITAGANNAQQYLQFRNDNNMFGQRITDGTLGKDITSAIVTDLFNRANRKEEGGNEKYIYTNVKISIDFESRLSAASTSNSLTVNPKSYYNGYDIINVIAHEIGHILDRQYGRFKNDWKNNVRSKQRNERVADTFAKHHWSNDKISKTHKERVQQHGKENGYSWDDL